MLEIQMYSEKLDSEMMGNCCVFLNKHCNNKEKGKNKDGYNVQSRTQSLLASYCPCLTKTKGSGKDRFLGDPLFVDF